MCTVPVPRLQNRYLTDLLVPRRLPLTVPAATVPLTAVTVSLPCLFQTRGYSFYLHVYFRQKGGGILGGKARCVRCPCRDASGIVTRPALNFIPVRPGDPACYWLAWSADSSNRSRSPEMLRLCFPRFLWAGILGGVNELLFSFSIIMNTALYIIHRIWQQSRNKDIHRL